MDCNPILWKIAPHTNAKHQILKRYVEAWAPILSQKGYNERLIYIDGFAGPGEYEDGEDGSPIVVLKALKNHSRQGNFKSKFRNLFIEICKERADHLRKVIEDRVEPLPSWIKYEVITNDFNQYIKGLMKYLEDNKLSLAPALTFVDPFGWKDLNYNVLSDLMKFEKGELLITFMAGFLDRFVWDDAHLPSIRKLFSDDQIKEIKKIEKTEDRERQIMEYFLKNLMEMIKSKTKVENIKYLAFSAYNSANRLEYYLIHLTKSRMGFYAMKQAMYKVSHDGSYKFSDFDFDPNQRTLVDYGVDESWIGAASEDAMRYISSLTSQGMKEIAISVIKDHVNYSTYWKYYNSILDKLEKDKKVQVVNCEKRRRGTFPDRCKISMI